MVVAQRRANMATLHFLFVFSIVISITQSCSVVDQTDPSDPTPKPCQFPFILDNQIFYGCTLYDTDDNKTWCSVNTDENHNHLKSWGHCDGTCTQDNFFDKDMNEVGLVVEKEIQEFEEEEDKEDPTVCLCVPLDECSWATRLTRATKYLSRRHPVFVRAKHFISKRVCPTENRQVHCCEKRHHATTNYNYN